jgi:molybdopterin synthase catalytic subunit
MQAIAVTGPGSGALIERLARRCPGPVATVTRTADRHGEEPAGDLAVRLAPDGWRATGEERPLEATLADLAPEYDYALVATEPGSEVDLPTVVVGDDGDEDGPELASVADPGAADLDALVSAIDGVEPYETLESLVARVKRAEGADRAGAIATFTGRVRRKDADDDSPTELLEFETYEGVADQRMATIEAELEARDGVVEVLMHHRTGVIPAGEDIVFVVVLAGHREEAFETVSDGIDRLKDEVPIFKKEVTTDEEFWVHDRP